MSPDLRYTLARALLALTCLLTCAAATARDVELRIVAFNDFHGHLEPAENTLLVPHPEDAARRVPLRTGGAAYFATLVKRLRADGAPVTGTNVLAVLREATDIEVPIIGPMDLTDELTYRSATVIRQSTDYTADPMTDETVTTVSLD